jgi:hypothetical protein
MWVLTKLTQKVIKPTTERSFFLQERSGIFGDKSSRDRVCLGG